ncbi:MAG: TlpA disulfide reductase family protein [Limnobacter sp.]|nr:TlpA disulfide reductase family protein [Limnobacter sp.]
MNKLITTLVALAALGFGIYLNVDQLTGLEGDKAGGYPLQSYTFNTPDGTSLDLGALEGKITVLNFWATWCPPCVEEMPELDELYTELKTKNIELIGIAVDSPSNVNEFLKKTKVSYPIVLAGLGGTELGKKMGNNQGGLPYTVVLDEKGKVLLAKAGRIQMQTIRDTLPR